MGWSILPPFHSFDHNCSNAWYRFIRKGATLRSTNILLTRRSRSRDKLSRSDYYLNHNYNIIFPWTVFWKSFHSIHNIINIVFTVLQQRTVRPLLFLRGHYAFRSPSVPKTTRKSVLVRLLSVRCVPTIRSIFSCTPGDYKIVVYGKYHYFIFSTKIAVQVEI